MCLNCDWLTLIRRWQASQVIELLKGTGTQIRLRTRRSSNSAQSDDRLRWRAMRQICAKDFLRPRTANCHAGFDERPDHGVRKSSRHARPSPSAVSTLRGLSVGTFTTSHCVALLPWVLACCARKTMTPTTSPKIYQHGDADQNVPGLFYCAVQAFGG